VDLHRIYEYALQREKEGCDFFLSNAKKVSHGAAVGIFEQLAAEEEKHIAYIEKLLKAFSSGEGAVPQPESEMPAGGFFSQRAQSEALDQTVIESMIPDVTVLRMAYLIERDFAEFYEMASGQAEGPARAALSNLAKWERGHEHLFKRLHDQVYKEYMKAPWGG
jgi:rubrerythrin